MPRGYVVLVRSLSAAVGVGMSGSTTCDSGGRHPSLALRPGVPVSEARGVGSRSAIPGSSSFPCPFLRLPPAFCTVGVGSRDTAVRRSRPPSPCAPAPFVSDVRGVGKSGEKEESLPLVGSADLVRAYNHPFRIEPDFGKVAEDSVEADSKVVRDVLKDRVSGS